MLQPDPLEGLKGLALAYGERDAEDAHDERHILKDREAADETEILEHEPNRSAVALHLR